jgi:hypothetical protein
VCVLIEGKIVQNVWWGGGECGVSFGFIEREREREREILNIFNFL